MTSDSKRDPIAGTAALTKGLQVLFAIGEANEPSRFTDIANRVGLAKGTLHRILAALARVDLIYFDSARQTYFLGPRLLSLAHKAWSSIDVRGVGVSELERIVEQTGEMVGLSQLDMPDTVLIEQRDTTNALGVRFAVGRRDPAFCSAAGKVLLAYQSPQRQAQLLGRIKLERFTSHTVVDRRAFDAELKLSRARGYAISDQEQFEGVRSVAAPIFAHTGEAIAAITVVGPEARLSLERLHVIGRDLIKAAQRITGHLGGSALHTDTPRRKHAPSPGLEVLVNAYALIGDSPYWSQRDRKLYWVDIVAPSVSRYDLHTGQQETRQMRELVGFVLDRASGGSVVSTQHGILSWDFETGTSAPLAVLESETVENRLNDGKCDRAGRLFAGTMSLDVRPHQGSLYQLSPDRSLRKVRSDVTTSNGIAWSPDNRKMYFVDSGEMKIFVMTYDIETGTAGEAEVFFESSPELGRPSGITTDAQGFLWCAMWDGWSVVRLDATGRIVETLYLPVPRPASCAFVGESYDKLVITTARIRLSEECLEEAPLSGSLFVTRPHVPGLPEQPYAG